MEPDEHLEAMYEERFEAPEEVNDDCCDEDEDPEED